MFSTLERHSFLLFQDIHECSGTNDCDPTTSTCSELPGSYECNCTAGHYHPIAGDHRNCARTLLYKIIDFIYVFDDHWLFLHCLKYIRIDCEGWICVRKIICMASASFSEILSSHVPFIRYIQNIRGEEESAITFPLRSRDWFMNWLEVGMRDQTNADDILRVDVWTNHLETRV